MIEPLFGNSNTLLAKEILPVAITISPLNLFGLVSILFISCSYFCFSKIVGFIITPIPELLSLNVDLAGTVNLILEFYLK